MKTGFPIVAQEHTLPVTAHAIEVQEVTLNEWYAALVALSEVTK
jgi:hypothetical protein